MVKKGGEEFFSFPFFFAPFPPFGLKGDKRNKKRKEKKKRVTWSMSHSLEMSGLTLNPKP
jgi:hypothetical protein